jgi:hypothetical protein
MKVIWTDLARFKHATLTSPPAIVPKILSTWRFGLKRCSSTILNASITASGIVF